MKELKASVIRVLLPQIILIEAARREIYGYRLIRSIRKRFDVCLASSMMYPKLNDMEKQGLIQSRWETVMEKRRRLYRVTKKGRRLLEQNDGVVAFVNMMVTVLEEWFA